MNKPNEWADDMSAAMEEDLVESAKNRIASKPAGTPAPPIPAGRGRPVYVLPWPPLMQLQLPQSSGQRCPLCGRHEPTNIEN
jgi:hypothetical protein